jgi:hypothetical protein
VLASVSAALSVHTAKGWSALIAIDGGTSLYSFGARADGRTVVDFAGPVLAARLGCMWAP